MTTGGIIVQRPRLCTFCPEPKSECLLTHRVLALSPSFVLTDGKSMPEQSQLDTMCVDHISLISNWDKRRGGKVMLDEKIMFVS